MDAHTKAMIATFVFMLVWITGAFVLFWHEQRYYKKNPHKWNDRGRGMVALSDNQRYWCYALWPLVVVGYVVFLIFILILTPIGWWMERSRDGRYEAKYPNIVKLEGVQFAGRSDVTLKKINGLFVPARPMGYASFKQRFKCAWLVFTGKADALVWPGDQ